MNALARRWRDDARVVLPRLAGTFGTSGASAALGVVSGTVAARVLAPSGRGDLALLLLWPQLVVTLGNLSVEAAATYLSADPRRRPNVPATTLALSAVQSVALVAVYLALVPFVLDEHLRRDALAMAPLIPLYLAGACAIDVLAGRLRFAAFNAVRITLPVLYCAAIVAFALAGVLTPIAGALAYLAAHACADALALALVWRDGGLGRVDRALAKEALHYGARAHVGRLAPQALGLDTALISLALSSHDVGLYSAATAFLAAPNLVASSVGMVVFPHVSAARRTGAPAQLGATFALHTAAVAVCALALIVAARPAVVLLFGDDYAGAVTPLRILALASVPLSLRVFPIEVLRGVGRPGLASVAQVADWALFLAPIPLGARVGGIAGAATGLAFAAGLSLAVLALLIRQTHAFAERHHAPALLEAA